MSSASNSLAGASLSTSGGFDHHPPSNEPNSNQQVQQAEAAVAQPPSNRLYRHALESIFAFLSLKELNSTLTVSHAWSSAVDSMSSIHASIVKLPKGYSWANVCASRLARHIGSIGAPTYMRRAPLNGQSLKLMALHMSRLHTLHCSLISTPPRFPPSLTKLTLQVEGSDSTEDLNLAILAASEIPTLTSLGLWLRYQDLKLSFAPLRNARKLQELELLMHNNNEWLLSAARIDELRAIPQLTSLPFSLKSAVFRLLLRSPHQLKLQQLLINGRLDDELVGLLVSLPSLTDLSLSDCRNATFLRALPNLQSLTLRQSGSPEQMIEGVGQCNKLTKLNISHGNLTSAHLSILLSRMSSLSELELEGFYHLDSLNFLSTGTLPSTLTNLHLLHCTNDSLHVIELDHVFELHQLTSLRITGSFAEKMDPLTRRNFTAPSQRLLKLISSKLEITKTK